MKHQQEMLSGFLSDSLPKILYFLGFLGFCGFGYFYAQDSHHAIYSYLTSFMFYLALSLGGMFFIIIHFLTRAGWSVVLRRIPENLMKNIGLVALFFIPILFNMHDLFHWTHPEAMNDHLLKAKSGYLNIPFFIIRAIFFFGIWVFLSRFFYTQSVSQDDDGSHARTLRMQKYSTFGVLLFAITLTFSAIDWVMSVTPHWYSTMFGVYYFATCAVSSLSVTTIILLILRRFGFMDKMVTVEHYHDLGKLMYGFNIFWTYVAFSQYFLIWYANIPEETIWFREHFFGSWNSFAIFLVIGHFVIPFLGFMSRHMKRNLATNLVFMIWMAFMSFVDLYWVIMPNVYPEGFHISLADVSIFLGMGGIYFGLLFWRLSRKALFPKKDPRLPESLHFHNV